MNLDNLKPAWRQFRLLNSMQPLDMEEILLMIQQEDDRKTGKIHSIIHVVIFIALTLCVQGG